MKHLNNVDWHATDDNRKWATEDSDKRVYRFPNLDGSSYVYKDRDDINNLLFSRYKNKINGSIIPKDSFTLNDSAATLRPSIYCDVIWDEVTERIISLPTGLVDIIDGERMTNGYVQDDVYYHLAYGFIKNLYLRGSNAWGYSDSQPLRFELKHPPYHFGSHPQNLSYNLYKAALTIRPNKQRTEGDEHRYARPTN